MRWTVPARGDIRRVADRAHLYDRIINNNRIILDGHGSPVTYWRNTALNSYGQQITEAKGGVRCYCWDSTKAQPDKRHFLCQGNGWVSHLYQKYGYHDVLFATPSANSTPSAPATLIKSSADIIITGDRNSSFTLSGASTSATLTTTVIPFTRFKEVSQILINDSTDEVNNRITYEYSLDGATWIPLAVQAYATPLSNRVAYLDIPSTSTQIQLRMTLKKKTASSSAPKWNSIRFRYRQGHILENIDDRFKIDIPSFLASRNNPEWYVTQGEYGWDTVKPYRWWTLPETKIENNDIIMFLTGEFLNKKFMVGSLVKYTYGPMLQLTHQEFESEFIRDSDDLMGILDYLV